MSGLSPHEENIRDFVDLAENQPELFTAEDRAALGELLATLPDDINAISDELTLWYEKRQPILDAILDLPVGEAVRGERSKTRLSPREVKEMIDNIVRQSTPPSESQISPPQPESQTSPPKQ